MTGDGFAVLRERDGDELATADTLEGVLDEFHANGDFGCRVVEYDGYSTSRLFGGADPAETRHKIREKVGLLEV